MLLSGVNGQMPQATGETAASSASLDVLQLPAAAQDCYYLNQSRHLEADGWDDAAEFEILRSALNVVGLSGARELEVLRTAAAVLHLGNVAFSEASTKEGAVASVKESSNASLETVATLLGLPAAQLTTVLTERPVKAGGSVIQKKRSALEAERTRDAMAKGIYVRLFDHLVYQMNDTLEKVGVEAAKAAGRKAKEADNKFVGLLDLFGFESFEHNSFEQLCINYANEKLQQFFVSAIFSNEESAHKEEGIPWPSIKLPDNSTAIDMIARKPSGVLHLLGSLLKSATEAQFFEAVNTAHKKSRAYKVPGRKTPSEGFMLRHYAGDIVYLASKPNAPTWFDKNSDTLTAEVEELLAVSPLSRYFVPPADAPNAELTIKEGKKQTLSVAGGFMRSVERLVKVLETTDVQFVRCIKPNDQQKPGGLMQRMVVDQLRCNGTMEAVEVMKYAYPTRIPLKKLVDEIAPRMPALAKAVKPEQGGRTLKKFIAVVLRAAQIKRTSYEVGQTKLFLKAGAGEPIEVLLQGDAEAEAALAALEPLALEEWKAVAAKIVGSVLMMWQHRQKFLRWETGRTDAAKRVQNKMRKKLQREGWVEVPVEVVKTDESGKRHVSIETKLHAPEKESNMKVFKRGIGKVKFANTFGSLKRLVDGEIGKERAKAKLRGARNSTMPGRLSTRGAAPALPRRSVYGEVEDREAIVRTIWGEPPVASEFTLKMMRDEVTGSLGMALNEFNNEVVVVQKMPGGPAEKLDTLRVGDIIAALDGSPMATVQELMQAMIKLPDMGVTLNMIRREVSTVKEGLVRLRFEDREGAPFKDANLWITSDRQLHFTPVDEPTKETSFALYWATLVELRHEADKADGRTVLRIEFEERAVEFYAASSTVMPPHSGPGTRRTRWDSGPAVPAAPAAPSLDPGAVTVVTAVTSVTSVTPAPSLTLSLDPGA